MNQPVTDELTANVEPPIVVDDEAQVAWSDEADAVVVGFGGAGVVAALQLREDGGSVIAVDRFGGGGATEKSGGVVYAGGTRFQREAGYDDTAEEMFKYLKFEGTPVRDETLRRFCETSSDCIDWLTGHGVKFGSTAYEERIAYPPDGYFLYYTGMEKFRTQAARPFPRGHRTLGKGATGRYYFPPLREAAIRAGVKVMLHAPVRRLVMNQTGRVIGVEVQEIPAESQAAHQELFKRVDPYKPQNSGPAEKAIAECAAFERGLPQTRKMIKARRGVILAAGGYNYNLKLFGRYRPILLRAYKDLVRGGAMGCDGSGIELGVTAGGALSHMDRLFITKAVSPPNAFVQGILVNIEGRRFIAEDAYVGNVGCAISEQPSEGAAWLILDAPTFWQGVRQATWPLKNIVSWYGAPAILNMLLGGTKRGRSLKDIAAKCGLAADALEATVAAHNADAARGLDTEQGKLSQHIHPQNRPPYYALNFSLRNRWGFSGCMPYGGLTVDEDTGNVTQPDGSIITGLYAAGRTAVGICSESNFSGLSIADTIFSGRRAARAVMQRNAPERA